MSKMKLFSCYTSVCTNRILYFFVFTCAIRSGLCSRIVFQNGAYNNILVALHPDTDPTNCIELVQNISEAFRIASTTLAQATNGLSRFGTIRILIPRNWGAGMGGTCNIPAQNITESPIYNSYENADFKIGTKHPFASKLPWTKQYKGCENESETIFVPSEFLTSSNFDTATRGRILMHEWAKFRYGVFEEFGYHNDPIFSPCYSMDGKDWYTSCSDVQIEPLRLRDSLTEPLTDEICRLLLQQKSTNITQALRSATSSIMFAPHLGNMVSFCNNETQVGLAPTKHNVLCERKSVAQIVFSHPDFQQIIKNIDSDDPASIFPNTRRTQNRAPRIEPVITLIRKSQVLGQGFAFLLEDDASIREFGRLQHVKQAIAQMLRLAPDQTNIGIARYEGIGFTFTLNKLTDDLARNHVLSLIPGTNTLGLLDTYKVSRNSRLLKDKIQSLKNILQALSLHQGINWEIIQVTSSPPVDIASTLDAIRQTDHSLSILTFNQSKDWLQFNTIPNTNKLIFLPQCAGDDLACHGITSSLFVDHFAQIFPTNSLPTRFTHKVMDFLFDGGAVREFTISENIFVGNMSRFYFFLPVYEENTVLSVQSPSGVRCPGVPLLSYSLVMTIDTAQCPYQMGTWKISVTGSEAANGFQYTLQGYAETLGTDHDLIVASSYGRKLSAEIFPRMMGGLPVYVSVSNQREQPVISASVELKIFHSSQDFNNSGKIRLLDNGLDPDLTANDGIYSGYVTSYNLDPSFHSGQVLVTTTAGISRAIDTLSSSGDAALLEPSMAPKCCGSSVPFQETNSVGNSAYSIVLPSFRTGESISATDDILPPSRISKISIIEASQVYMILEFTAPGSNYSTGTVSNYDICCTNSTSGILDDSLCKSVASKECLPVESGTVQSCRIFLRDIGLGFFNYTGPEPGNPTTPDVHSLYCSLRGVDSSKNSGPLSYTLFEVLIDSQIIAEGYGECNSVSDGCLPITVFWVLIGCAGFLMILIFILLLCWFCSSRKKKKEINKASADANSVRYIGGFPDESGNAALHNVYINQAYIQDSNGHLKLVASDGELIPFDSIENGRFPSEPSIRRRSTSGTEDASRKHVSWNGGGEKDMPVYFSADKPENHSSAVSLPQLETSSPTPKKPYSASNPPRPSDDRASLQLRSTFRPASESSNTLSLPRIGNSQIIPSINSTIEQQEVGPVYASVTRAGRKSSPYSSGQGYTPSFGSPLSPQAPDIGARPVTPPVSYSIASRPANRTQPAVVVPPARTPGIVPSAVVPMPKYIHNRPPIRMDHFPSSESEIYSDMSHIMPNYRRPASAQAPVSASPAHNFSRDVSTRQEIIGPGTRNSSPSKAISGLGRREGPSGDVSRPPVFPPPPPPPRQTFPSTSPPRNQEDDEYDDDSDNWDNYEDFQFNNPGAGSSYA